MGKVLYTDEMKSWLIENYPSLGSAKATKLFNDKFGTSKNRNALRSYCLQTLKLKVSDEAIHDINSTYDWDNEFLINNYNKHTERTSLYRAYIKYNKNGDTPCYTSFKRQMKLLGLGNSPVTWTEEQEKWIKKNYSKYTYTEAEKWFNRRFKTNRTASAIASKAGRLGVSSRQAVADDLSIRTYKGCVPQIKVNGKWMKLSRYTYEKERGKIPKGYAIIHLDNDIMNCNINNLCAVPKNYIAILNGYNMKSSIAEITKTGVVWCELYTLLQSQGCDMRGDV